MDLGSRNPDSTTPDIHHGHQRTAGRLPEKGRGRHPSPRVGAGRVHTCAQAKGRAQRQRNRQSPRRPRPTRPSRRPRTRQIRQRRSRASRSFRGVPTRTSVENGKTGKRARSRQRPGTRSCSASSMRRSAAPPHRRRNRRRNRNTSHRLIRKADHRGFANHLMQQQAATLLNERLNNSEMMLREKIGDEEARQEPWRISARWRRPIRRLFGKLYFPAASLQLDDARGRSAAPAVRDRRQPTRRRHREKILAEGRAAWEPEKAAPAPSPAAGMQPSLATARSVAGRSAGAWTGEPSLEDVLAPVQNRRKTNGSAIRY